MANISEEMRTKVGRFGRTTLSVVEICETELEARKKRTQNLTKIKAAFNIKKDVGYTTGRNDNEALTELRIVKIDLNHEAKLAALQNEFKPKKVGFDQPSGAYVIHWG